MIALRDKELSKLSIILSIPEDQLSLLHSMHLLDESMVIDLLVKFEYSKLKSTHQYKVKHIIAALAKEYQITEHKVNNAIYNKKLTPHHCKQCGRPITDHRFRAHDGICEACVVDSIKI